MKLCWFEYVTWLQEDDIDKYVMFMLVISFVARCDVWYRQHGKAKEWLKLVQDSGGAAAECV